MLSRASLELCSSSFCLGVGASPLFVSLVRAIVSGVCAGSDTECLPDPRLRDNRDWLRFLVVGGASAKQMWYRLQLYVSSSDALFRAVPALYRYDDMVDDSGRCECDRLAFGVDVDRRLASREFLYLVAWASSFSKNRKKALYVVSQLWVAFWRMTSPIDEWHRCNDVRLSYLEYCGASKLKFVNNSLSSLDQEFGLLKAERGFWVAVTGMAHNMSRRAGSGSRRSRLYGDCRYYAFAAIMALKEDASVSDLDRVGKIYDDRSLGDELFSPPAYVDKYDG